MYINRNVAWTSVKSDLPHNTRNVVVVVRSEQGVIIVGAWYAIQEERWIDTYTNAAITHEVLCWTDIEIPEQNII